MIMTYEITLMRTDRVEYVLIEGNEYYNINVAN